MKCNIHFLNFKASRIRRVVFIVVNCGKHFSSKDCIEHSINFQTHKTISIFVRTSASTNQSIACYFWGFVLIKTIQVRVISTGIVAAFLGNDSICFFLHNVDASGNALPLPFYPMSWRFSLGRQFSNFLLSLFVLLTKLTNCFQTKFTFNIRSFQHVVFIYRSTIFLGGFLP